MVTITEHEVADALHLESASELPAGAESDIASAEYLVGDQVEPHTDASDRVKQTAIFVAAAFITGTENDVPVQSISRNGASISYASEFISEEGMDHWARAQAMDPSDRLGRDTIGFDAF